MLTAPTGTSTYVTARMNVNGLMIPVAQMCPDFVILRDTPPRIAPCHAEIIMEVDGAPTAPGSWSGSLPTWHPVV